MLHVSRMPQNKGVLTHENERGESSCAKESRPSRSKPFNAVGRNNAITAQYKQLLDDEGDRNGQCKWPADDSTCGEEDSRKVCPLRDGDARRLQRIRIGKGGGVEGQGRGKEC